VLYYVSARESGAEVRKELEKKIPADLKKFLTKPIGFDIISKLLT